MNFIIWLVVGSIIGWIASMIMRTDAQQGMIVYVVVGIVGSMLGGWLISPIVGAFRRRPMRSWGPSLPRRAPAAMRRAYHVDARNELDAGSWVGENPRAAAHEVGQRPTGAREAACRRTGAADVDCDERDRSAGEQITNGHDARFRIGEAGLASIEWVAARPAKKRRPHQVAA